MEERGSKLETLATEIKKFNKNYAEVSEWLERAEKFQSEQKTVEMDLHSLGLLIKEQKVSFGFIKLFFRFEYFYYLNDNYDELFLDYVW